MYLLVTSIISVSTTVSRSQRYDHHHHLLDVTAQIFGMETMQDEVFEKAAKPVVLRYALVITTNHHLSAIEGYNGTVFAYGQTGSGKTYTMTGGTEKYADRGIIPRALQLLFRTTSQDVHHTYNVHCSFMEIYNEKIYDLLDPQHESRPLDQLESVKMRTDEDGSIIFHGTSMMVVMVMYRVVQHSCIE